MTIDPAIAYERDGYLFPVNIYTEEEAVALRRKLESAETDARGNCERELMLKRHVNWILPFVDEITRHPAILDAVELVLGKDLLVYSADIFIKEPGTANFITWHQDLHYWGLDATDEVTAWLALSPATPQSGCMRYAAGTHKQKFDHRDTGGDNNMLSRGQEVAVEIDEDDAVHVELKPGQLSLHHGRTCHASGPNSSNDRRIGLAIRYIKPSMKKKADEKPGANLVRGQDAFGNFELIPPPTSDFEPEAMDRWRKLIKAEDEILYA